MDRRDDIHVHLEGDLGLAQQAQVSDALPLPAPSTRVIIDCSKVTSIDSAIIRVFMRYRRSYAEAGGDSRTGIVIVASPQVRRIFDIAGLAQWVTIVNAADKP